MSAVFSALSGTFMPGVTGRGYFNSDGERKAVEAEQKDEPGWRHMATRYRRDWEVGSGAERITQGPNVVWNIEPGEAGVDCVGGGGGLTGSGGRRTGRWEEWKGRGSGAGGEESKRWESREQGGTAKARREERVQVCFMNYFTVCSERLDNIKR